MKRGRQTPRALKTIRYGSHFSGMEMYAIAFRKLVATFLHVFSCDNYQPCRHLITTFRKPAHVYDDVASDAAKSAPAVDVFCFSPPCQSWSNMGKKMGAKDGRGRLVVHSLKYIKTTRPRLAIMEQVSTKRFTNMLKKIQKLFSRMGYVVYTEVMYTQQHGVPQNRMRTYLVAIRTDSLKSNFEFPEGYALPPGAATRLLKRRPGDDTKALPPPHQRRARKHVKMAYRKMLERGINPRRNFLAVDVDGSDKFQSVGHDAMPTITAQRGRACAWWLSLVGRRINLPELFKFQGLRSAELGDWQSAGISDGHMGHMLGNAVSLNVVERIMSRALFSAGLVRRRLPDRWAP